jgi:two-component system chemotaxis response regulator CheY
MHALVIDDSKATRVILKGILESLGFDVLQAGDGREAIERMEQAADIVIALVDWIMPVMNGYEFIQHIRSYSRYDETKLMMVTTEAGMEQVIDALEAGADEYLMKPFTSDAIIEKLGLLGIEGR